MARETWVQSQVESYQRLKKWYLMPPCLTLSIIRYGSRVKWSNPGKGVAPFPTPWCSSYRKGSLRVTLDYGRQLYLLTMKNAINQSRTILTLFFRCRYHHALLFISSTEPYSPTNPNILREKNTYINIGLSGK